MGPRWWPITISGFVRHLKNVEIPLFIFLHSHLTTVKRQYSRNITYVKFITLFHHRLNGSSSPVLTATCLSYGSLCDFLGFFSRTDLEVTPSTDFDAKCLKPRGFTQGRAFWSKNRTFLKSLTPRPPKPPKFAQFWSGQNFRSISRLTLEVSRVNTP